ncbi:MAG: aminomethyltransferase beta-barrel domain-containing protein, partial [Bdellovibrionota bacterium]
GEILADHDGIHHYTYGQRKGLGVFRPEPVFVIKIDAKTSEVWVGDEKHLYGSSAKVVQAHLIDEVGEGETLRVKIRFQHKGSLAKVFKKDDGFAVEFEEPVRALTPGQAAVFYRGDQLVGGGWIV